MPRGRKYLVAAGLLAAGVAGFGAWYRWSFSMRPAQTYEVGSRHSSARVLIATQGSEFKDAVVWGLMDFVAKRSAYGRVVDVSTLGGVREDEWTAIVIVHTWEMGKPPAVVSAFVGRVAGRDNILALTTSGRGDFRLEGVDAISSASRLADAPLRIDELTSRLDRLLAARP